MLEHPRMRQYVQVERDNLIAADNQQGRPGIPGTLRDYTPRGLPLRGKGFSASPVWMILRYSPSLQATARGRRKRPVPAFSGVTICEKQLAGSGGGDLSGVSSELHGTLLTWMQNHRANGSIFIGPPGAAKSVMAKATGNTGGIPTIEFDMGGMKAGIVGESNARMRQALKEIESVSQGRSY